MRTCKMYWIALMVLCVLNTFCGCVPWKCQSLSGNLSSPLTTVLLVRHAEKAGQGQDPPLSTEGQQRAQTLVHVLGKAKIAAVYVTEYQRTQQTAKPLCDQLGLSFKVVNANNVDALIEQALEDYTGKVVLVVGHSNTVPEIIKALSGKSIPSIPENEFDNLFVVTVSRFGKGKVLNLKYGDPS